MTDFSNLIYFLVIISAVLNLFTVFQISKLPDSDHRFKRYWTNIVLFFPIFGALIYHFNKKTSNGND